MNLYEETKQAHGRDREARLKDCDDQTQSAGCAIRAYTPQEKIDYLFTFHDDPDKAPHYVEIREAAKKSCW
jgi:hypothetical protein